MGMEIKSVTAEVVEYLRNKIIIGELAPGQKLDENPLSSDLGVSRPPLREAFRILERENIVLNIPRKGTYVTEISKKDLQNLYYAREMIDCYAIDLFEVQNVRHVSRAASALELARGLTVPPLDNPREYLAYYEMVSDFHFKLIEATGNPWLISFKYAIYSNQARYRLINIRKSHASGSLETSLKEHQQILDALGIGDYGQAKKIMKYHVKRGLLAIENSIA
jgi:DNA-binding GntR family transcriptional regulator